MTDITGKHGRLPILRVVSSTSIICITHEQCGATTPSIRVCTFCTFQHPCSHTEAIWFMTCNHQLPMDNLLVLLCSQYQQSTDEQQLEMQFTSNQTSPFSINISTKCSDRCVRVLLSPPNKQGANMEASAVKCKALTRSLHCKS